MRPISSSCSGDRNYLKLHAIKTAHTVVGSENRDDDGLYHIAGHSFLAGSMMIFKMEVAVFLSLHFICRVIPS
jgi:hypothetical protein